MACPRTVHQRGCFGFLSFSWGLADEAFLDGSDGDIFVFSPTRCDPHLSDAINPKTRIAFACRNAMDPRQIGLVVVVVVVVVAVCGERARFGDRGTRQIRDRIRFLATGATGVWFGDGTSVKPRNDDSG